MVGFGKDKLILIQLSKEEQLGILKHCELLPPHIHRKIELATDGALYLMEGDADILNASLCYTSQEVNDENITTLFDGLINRIPLSNEVTKHLDKFANPDCADPQVSKKIWDEIEEEKKTTPDPHRGDLTPQQIKRFQEYHWGNAEFPLQFSHNLSLKEVNQSMFFRNAKLFLNKLIEFKDKPTATAKGNLNRKFVKLMFDEMEMDEEYRDSTIRYNKVLNEDDVFPLHIIRIVCEGAGLIRIRSNKITVLKKYYSLLSEEKAGELYYQLFDAYFNKFNLSYLDGLQEMDGIQGTLDFSFYRLSVLCDNYQSIEDLFYEAFLPSIINEIEEESSEYVRKEWYLTSRIINPLVGFGLLECQYKKEKHHNRMERARKTPLYDKFISLNL